MNIYTEIIIEGVKVAAFEGDEDLQFKFSYRVSDSVGNTRGSSADRFIKLPATKETNSLYGTFQDINVRDKTAYLPKSTIITENGVVVFEGLSFLQRLTTTGKGRPYNRTGNFYEILLVGSNANWKTRIKGLKLSELPFETLPFDAATIQASEEYSYDGGNQSAWGLIKWKSWNNETITSINHSVKVQYSEFTPLLFNRSIIDLIFDSIGYNIEGDLLNSSTLKSTVMVVPPVEKYPPEYSKEFLNVSASSGTVQFVAGQPVNIPLPGLNTTNIAPNPRFTWTEATATYDVQEDGFIKVKVDLEVLAAGAGSFVVIGATFNAATTFSDPIVQIGAATSSAPIVGQQSYGEKVYKVFTGDSVTIRIFYAIANGTTMDLQYDIAIEGESLYKIGTSVNFNYLLGDYLATDYLTFLEDQFNARFDVDEAKRIVYINSRNSFVDVPPTAIGAGSFRDGFYNDSVNDDYTNKLDYNKDAKIKSFTSKRNFVYSYETDGETEEAVETGAALGIASASYDTETNQEGTEEKTARFFAKTPCILDRQIQLSPTNPIANPSNKTPLVPLIFNGDYTKGGIVDSANYKVKPRILHFIGNRGTNATKINIDDSSQNDVLTIADLFFTNYNDRYGADPSLSYANETINGNLVTGLVDRFFLHELATIRNNKRVDEWIVWDSLMINNLSFRNTLLLHGTRFINDEIQDYTPSTRQSIKTMLVPFLLATEEDQGNIENTLLSGIINKL